MTIQNATVLDSGLAQEGITVVDPSGPLVRTWYFDGRFLRADGFRTDQAYERSLASLVAQGNGTGVVHGLEVAMGTGDQLRVEAGLALAPSGRAVLLTRQIDLPTATLIARARGIVDPTTATGGNSAFGPCAGDDLTGDVPVLPATTLWLLTVAATETLCGEEERFGQLCADACATETDRSQLVEGVIFRVHPVSLPLTTPTTVTMTAAHLRSRVASAWFAAERQAISSIVSGPGLHSQVWCLGADAVGGDEVPLAVLQREGSVSKWVDGWTARRELLETTPRRYWQQRIAMRPVSVASAQLSQFQCQLVDLVLPTTATVSGSILLDAGIVELPSAGYLQIDPTGDVEAQVRAKFGAGVDLRFCVGRSDVVPGLVEDAQHRDRISLTKGLDDPAAKEEVDILVPDGTLTQTQVSLDALVGTARTLPAVRDGESGSAISLATMARDSSGTGWTWCAAGTGQLPAARMLDPVTRLARGQTQRQRRLATVDAAIRAMITPDDTRADGSDRAISVWAQIITSARVDTLQPGDTTDVRARLTYAAAVDDVSALDTRFSGELRVVQRQAGTANGAPTVQLLTVLDGFMDTFTIDNGEPKSRVTPIRALQVGWEFGVDDTGAEQLQVGFTQGRSGLVLSATSSGVPRKIQAVLSQFVLRPTPGLPTPGLPTLPILPPVVPVEGKTSDWTSGVGGRFARIFERMTKSGMLSAVPGLSTAGPNVTPIGTVELTDTAGAATPGTPTREQADTAIELLAATLAGAGRDPAFAVGARALLYGGPATTVTPIKATRDWVLFHRRETITCQGDQVVQPAVSTLRLYNAGAASSEDLQTILDNLVNGTMEGTGGFEPVIDLDFAANSAEIVSSVPALRIAWQSANRPSELAFMVAAGGAEGQLIAGARINALRTALSGLVTADNADVRFLPDVPPGLTALGIDGVLLTGGIVASTQPSARCVRILRTDRDMAAKILATLNDLPADPGVPIEDFLRSRGFTFDAFTATFTEGALSNLDPLRQWWKGFNALATQLMLPDNLGEVTDTVDARTERAKEALAALHLDIQNQARIKIAMPICGVTALITTG
ncbi:hypothetical protein [Kribbella pratensis]|uniref:Uncharacterized protein n=1 Tax=Kribbella pratensis TaxID=2512112 RepID=A0A4R8CM58_9ACTN|nr:hypothetical protein [Kribbella pratensis]TDW77148.1 hypothetical protein EV653_2312 [Kribbella pratensis]